MKKSELNPHPDLEVPPIPVICDRCRAEGTAGGDSFTEIADLLNFKPVPRRAHVNNWTAEHQRAFVAGLAITGSPSMAARALGRHAFGAEQLKTAKGGRGFAESCDAALELYREREIFRIRDNLAALAEQQEQRDEGGLRQSHLRSLPPPTSPSPASGRGRDPHGEAGWEGEGARDEHDSCPHCGGEAEPEWRRHQRERDEQLSRVRRSLFMARRVYLLSIADDSERRAAWELLCGPADWQAAAAMQAQPDENSHSADVTPLREATLQVPLKTGFAPNFTDPGWDEHADPLPQFEQSVLRHDPRWNGDCSALSRSDGEGDHPADGGGAEEEGE